MNEFKESLKVDDIPEEIQRGYIEVEPNTEQDYKKYKEHKEQRNKRVYRKMGYEYRRGKVYIDEKWQKEIFLDNLEEMR